MFLRRVAYAVSDVFWPRTCYLCGVALPDEPDPDCFCAGCTTELTADPHSTCPRCSSTVGAHSDTTEGCPRCRDDRFKFASAVRLNVYAGKLREVILTAKRRGQEGVAETIGRVWAIHRCGQLTAANPEVVVPVPLHWRRRWARGFNQAEAVARGVAAVLGLPLLPFALRKVRPTPMQTDITPTARRNNVVGAFAPANPRAVSGMRVLLIDDVLTTGATANAAATALLAGGAAQVAVAVLAHR